MWGKKVYIKLLFNRGSNKFQVKVFHHESILIYQCLATHFKS